MFEMLTIPEFGIGKSGQDSEIRDPRIAITNTACYRWQNSVP